MQIPMKTRPVLALAVLLLAAGCGDSARKEYADAAKPYAALALDHNISCYGICYGFWQHENTRSCNISLSKTFAPLAQLAEQVTLNDRPSGVNRPALPNTLRTFRMNVDDASLPAMDSPGAEPLITIPHRWERYSLESDHFVTS
jgi:hypothetical protein